LSNALNLSVIEQRTQCQNAHYNHRFPGAA
jgi:hypothetical protein